LVVDDENDILDMTCVMLTSSGHDVLTASDGEKALEMVKNNKIDLIVLDAVMPGMNGLDVCRARVDMMLDKRDKAEAYISARQRVAILHV
jgi:DNA-binding response OmpR family regulator